MIHDENMQGNPRINRQDRQGRSRSMDLLTPSKSPNSALPLHTQKQCPGVFHPCLRSLKAPDYFRGALPSFLSALWHQYPET